MISEAALGSPIESVQFIGKKESCANQNQDELSLAKPLNL